MDTFETPYEDELEFIQCTVCDKSIRGETLYKIHLTTPGHLKKEDAFVAEGHAVRKNPIPVFEDILQYLDYVKLDEPIIGLDYLEELPCNDPQGGPRYTCKLCHHTANLPEAVHHVIGRKHRQKYVELKRPDLVTWDKQSIVTQGGKIIRARAQIIERQDGRGIPVLMTKKPMGGQLNMSRGPPQWKQNRGQNISTQRDVPSHRPQLMNYQDEYSHRGRYPPEHSNTPPVHPEDSYTLSRARQMYQREDKLSHYRMQEELQRGDHRGSDMGPDYHREYQEEYVEDPQRRAALKPGGVPGYDSREEMLRGQTQHGEYYSEEAPSYTRPQPETDPLKEFYTEEVRRGRVRSAKYQPSLPAYPEGDNRRWSLERESGRHDVGMNRAGRQGSSEPEAQRRSFPTPMEGNHLFNIIRDNLDEIREPHHEEAVANPGPGRTGPPNPQRRVEGTRIMSDIPEPFRRFLKRAANDDGQGKRKRKSRFSDATAEEVETTREMFSDEYGPQNPKFGGRPGPVSVPLRPEIHDTQHPNLYMQSQSPDHTEGYQREGSGSGGVFDMLKNIEIENAEEADFLKSKLCNLLKEFKTKKEREKAAQNSQGRPVMSKDYDSLEPNSDQPPRHPYEPALRRDSDLRRPEDVYLKEDHRGRGWNQEEHIPDERLPEYNNPVCGDPRPSNRSRYEEVFGRQEMSRTPHAPHPDEPARFPQRFQEPMHRRDYRPAAAPEESHSSASALHMERGPRMDRGPRYSNNLDKITSTLLELVARK